MKRIVSLFIVLSLVFAFGCAGEDAEKESEPVPAPQPDPVPDINPVEHEDEEVVKPPTGEAEDVEEEDGTIGSRAEGTVKESEPEDVSEGVEEIRLEPDKTMSETEMTVSRGTTLAWKNYDLGWPHDLAVESGSGWDAERHARSGRLLDEEVWEYTFEEPGTYTVRDIFSGDMRMTVTVE